MKYLVIDTETTSIKPENGDLLSFAAVLEDTNNILPVEELPSFYCVFKHKTLKGEPYALNMNKGLIEEIKENKSENLIDIDNFTILFNNFLAENGLENHNNGYSETSAKNNKWINSLGINPKPIKLKSCGKNFGTFDKLWIEEKIPYFSEYFQFNHRILDPGSVMVDFKNDEWLPNLLECKKRAGVKGEVTHNALVDCYDVIEVLRTKY